MKDKLPTDLEMQNMNNQVEQLKNTITDLKDQIKITNIDLANVKKELESIKLEIIELKGTLKYMEKDFVNMVEDVKKDFAPIQRIATIISGIIVTALVGALLALILKS